jgi:prepilin-type N-terminal cleavage/methylation domain-containing protein
MKKGFTLIELLVAMAILAILVVAVTQLFYQGTVAWESGHRRTQTAMVGRAIAGYVVEDVSLAVWDDVTLYPQPPSSGSNPTFASLDGTNGLIDVVDYTFAGGDLSRNGVPLYKSTDLLEITGFNVEFDLTNAMAEVMVRVITRDKGRDEERAFLARTLLVNRNRYVFD